MKATRTAYGGGKDAAEVVLILIAGGGHTWPGQQPPVGFMIEPTETESKETLNEFIAALVEIARLAEEDPEAIKSCPKTTPVGGLDEVAAARRPDLASL